MLINNFKIIFYLFIT
jgi:uncharacterized membrane protein YgdD (TMEM256/DUF423 family)